MNTIHSQLLCVASQVNRISDLPPPKTFSESLYPFYNSVFQFLKWDLYLLSAAGEVAMHMSESVCVWEQENGGVCVTINPHRDVFIPPLWLKKSMYHLKLSVMLRVVIFIVVAKFNYTTFTPRYFYSVIRQINLNQSEHDLAWFKNACANVSQVSDSRPHDEAVVGF